MCLISATAKKRIRCIPCEKLVGSSNHKLPSRSGGAWMHPKESRESDESTQRKTDENRNGHGLVENSLIKCSVTHNCRLLVFMNRLDREQSLRTVGQVLKAH